MKTNFTLYFFSFSKETPKSDAPPYKIPPTNGSEKNSHDIIDGPVNNDHALVIRREPDGKDQDALNEAEDDKNANDGKTINFYFIYISTNFYCMIYNFKAKLVIY